MTDFSKLPTRGPDGAIHVVVETPRGMTGKVKFEPKLGVFVFSRSLKLGLRYPYDWGFVPGTLAPDGDPLDAMILTDVIGFPGLVVPCRAVAVLDVDQEERGKRFRNDRVLFVPAKGSDLVPDEKEKRDLERFFCDAVADTGKVLHILGWRGADAAAAEVERCCRRFEKRAAE
jgi:inorganic pyrophosphatase